MNCYKCNSPDNLSIKARHRDGRVRLMICKTCRRNLWKASKPRITEGRITPAVKDWTQYANETNSRIARKYAQSQSR